MDDQDRLKFDVAFALAVFGSNPQLQLSFPEKLELSDKAEKILTDCIDPNSYEDSFYRLRNQIPEEYKLELGDHTLSLFPGGEIRAGGSGVTVELYDPELTSHYALKVPRASLLAYVSGGVDRLAENKLIKHLGTEFRAFDNEKKISRRLSHQNIARYLYGNSKQIPDLLEMLTLKFPYSVSEWIDGARPLHKYLIEKRPSVKELIAIISDTYSALTHIHEQKILHWDIKSHNILISKNKIVKLIDFGNAKLWDLPADDDLTVTTSKGKYPSVPVFEVIDTPNAESRRFSISLPHQSWNHPQIDLWMLAQEWNRCLGFSDAYCIGLSDIDVPQIKELQTSIFERRLVRPLDAFECLRIIFERVLYPFHENHVNNFINADKSFNSSQLYYQSASEVFSELSRILPSFGAAQDVPELMISLDEIIRLPVTGNSVFTDRIAALVETTVVQPTKLHYQLGQVREVFPGATHSRFEHLLGTVTTTAFFVRSLYLNEMNAFWRVSLDADDVTAVLIAAILHDSGHLAFGHFIEEMDDLLGPWKHESYVIELLKACRESVTTRNGQDSGSTPGTENDVKFDLPPQEVEELTEVLKNHFCEDNLIGSNGEEQIIRLLDRITAILGFYQPELEESAPYLSRKGTRATLDRILKSIIDGPIDADKLDYLRRDSFHAGVYFANGIDLERFFESLRVCVNTTPDGVHSFPAIGVSEKGIAPIETIITARYHLYSVVYWHRTVRCITAMLQRVISEIRLALADAEWNTFLSGLLSKFRKLDDRQALEWLRSELKSRGLLEKPIGKIDGAETDHTKVSDLMEALFGNRNKYFHMAFELGYVGPIELETTTQGKTARESVHDHLCKEVHPEGVGALTEFAVWSEHGTTIQENRRKFRLNLESLFSAEVQKRGLKKFELDTILLDVPETGKDELGPLYVDRRSKRTMSRDSQPRADMTMDSDDFVSLVSVSPIAASLKDVFNRWARKVRIFMTKRDLEHLGEFGLEPGDVAAIWQAVLYKFYGVDASQNELRGIVR